MDNYKEYVAGAAANKKPVEIPKVCFFQSIVFLGELTNTEYEQDDCIRDIYRLKQIFNFVLARQTLLAYSNNSIILSPQLPLFRVVLPAKLAFDAAFLFDPLLEAGHVNVGHRSRAQTGRAHLFIAVPEPQAYSALEVLLVVDLAHFNG